MQLTTVGRLRLPLAPAAERRYRWAGEMPQCSFETIAWCEPWHPIANEETRSALEKELLRELAPGHVLHDRPVRAVGRRQDCDDVLYAFGDQTECAVVHLTWASSAPETPPWPFTETFADSDAFVSECMLVDHRDLFGEGEHLDT